MRVFVTGATGFIGSAVIKQSIGAGHQVLGLARSDTSAQSLIAAGARVHRGSLEDLESLRRGAAASEGAIHTGFFHEFTHAILATRLRVIFGGAPGAIVSRFMAAAAETDRRAIETIGRPSQALTAPSSRRLGRWAIEPGQLATEEDAADLSGFRAPCRVRSGDARNERVRPVHVRCAPFLSGSWRWRSCRLRSAPHRDRAEERRFGDRR